MNPISMYKAGILLLCLWLGACKFEQKQFVQIPVEVSGIDFSNRIEESDSINILKNEYIYNGGGVGVGDFDQNGLMDLFFSGNMVTNRLYLNQGEFRFRDISEEAGISGENRWSSGISVVDINQDGQADIHVCATNRSETEWRINQLYVHQGLNAEGIPVFKDMALAYGLADSGHCTNAAFFDYDRDGDLDVFLIIDELVKKGLPNQYHEKVNDGSSHTTDKLYRNDWNDSLGHPVFTDVSKSAGILKEGFSLGLNITDINLDGWPDIFITNDYVTNDIVYINQGDGTFIDQASDMFKHTCHSAMGNDVADLDGDGRLDILALDMMPEDNYRKKTMLLPNNYSAYLNNDYYGYDYQYVRNVFQRNEGFVDETGLPVFSEIAMMAGISSTDWSWTPSVADFDLDGYRDILITNGFPKDVTDRDFIEYYSQNYRYASYTLLSSKMPSVKLANYAYRNEGNRTFSNQTINWGINIPSFSNGAVYVDLDNDGYLDYVVNNINDPAFIFKNNGIQQREEDPNWLSVHFTGTAGNLEGLGTKCYVYANGQKWYAEYSPYRGYLSSVDPRLHFGLGAANQIDSIRIIGPRQNSILLSQIPANQFLEIDLNSLKDSLPAKRQNMQPLFSDISHSAGIQYIVPDSDYIDFNTQRLLPHKLSQYGPGLAVADVNQDGLDDFYVGGSHFFKGKFFIQQKDGAFVQEDRIPHKWTKETAKTDSILNMEEELGCLFFDVDLDGDPDLYLVSGGNEFTKDHPSYQDRLYINENGKFVLANQALPAMLGSGSCVKAADYNGDGYLDLFVGERHIPEQYPKAASGYLLINESKKGKVSFVIDEKGSAPFKEIGLICDALWTDFDDDGWVDLLLAGEWMPLRFFKNNSGQFKDLGTASGIHSYVGWWNSLASGDFDQDGDLDYVAGNLGLNTLNQASDTNPLGIYAADFDQNGSYDAIPTIFFPNQKGELMEVPFLGRLDYEKQLISIKQAYLKHADFGRSDINQILGEPLPKDLLRLEANHMANSWIENLGNGQFRMHQLPIPAQSSPVYGMLVEDVNRDGYPDLLMIGNDYGTELTVGRYDAFNGLVLLGDGKGKFWPVKREESGLYVPGDGKALAVIRAEDMSLKVISTENKGPVRLFGTRESIRLGLPLKAMDYKVIFDFPDGRRQKVEVYYGNGYLAQSSRYLAAPKGIRGITIYNYLGEERSLVIPGM